MTHRTDLPAPVTTRAPERRGTRLARRRALIALTVAVAVAVAAAALIATMLRSGVERPSAIDDDGGFTIPADEGAHVQSMGDGARPVHLDLFLDYTDAASARFGSVNAQTIRAALDRGTIEVSLHPVALGQTDASRADSLRTANAIACVAEFSPASLWSFQAVVLASQSDDAGQALSADDLVSFADDTSVTPVPAARECIRSERYAGWVEAATREAARDGVGSAHLGLAQVPVVLADGVAYRGDPEDGAAFAAFLSERAGA